MRYYDQENQRLVYIEENATPEFWDRQWEDKKLRQSILAGAKERFVYPITRRYLKPGSKILEGGCGKGQFVYSLHARGYDAIGVDFAAKTVAKVTSLVPGLNIQIGDVRQLNFPDSTFDGYWSLGVIEHFYDGYDTIADEMHRVLRPGGYLFLTFPYMSPLRRFKSWLGLYPRFQTATVAPKAFYQFALPHKAVTSRFEKLGFELVLAKPYEGFKGLKDESGPVRPALQWLYNNRSFIAQGINYVISHACAPFSSHTILLVLKKSV